MQPIGRDTRSLEKDDKRPKKSKRPSNPLQAGILDFLHDLDPQTKACSQHVRTILDDSQRMSLIPKRYTIYHPMLLLGVTFPCHTPAWRVLYVSLSEGEKTLLFSCITARFGQLGVTHVALNAPILPITISDTNCSNGLANKTDGGQDEHTYTHIEGENIMRSPVNLVPLYGNFGPDRLLCREDTRSDAQYRGDDEESSKALPLGAFPASQDFDAAFWVSAKIGTCKQGASKRAKEIVQVWAPRWTMFSRGNIAEKARILESSPDEYDEHREEARVFPGLDLSDLQDTPIDRTDVVDFYVGIGYFAFCYLARGVRRVYGWEINAWSVEGLRRGCKKNGWECLVVEIESFATEEEVIGHALNKVAQALRQEPEDDPIRCVAFFGDNKWAGGIMSRLRMVLQSGNHHQLRLNVRHCNLGLLPSSERSWENAIQALSPEAGGWLHVHENAEIVKVEAKMAEVLDGLERLVSALRMPNSWRVSCQNSVMVKTYAPGIGHFVFDISIHPVPPPCVDTKDIGS